MALNCDENYDNHSFYPNRKPVYGGDHVQPVIHDTVVFCGQYDLNNIL